MQHRSMYMYVSAQGRCSNDDHNRRSSAIRLFRNSFGIFATSAASSAPRFFAVRTVKYAACLVDQYGWTFKAIPKIVSIASTVEGSQRWIGDRPTCLQITLD
jgi:hypothetical protein